MKPKIAIVVSRFNEEITQGLLFGALGYLGEKGYDSKEIDIYYAPGAFELPLISKKLAESGDYEGVICLGCVIKGDTAHFEFISLSAALGVMHASLQTEIPIHFGILTTYTVEQAQARAQQNGENKGREAAAACVETVELLKQIKKPRKDPTKVTTHV